MIAIQLAVLAAKNPAAPAVVFGERQISYATLHARACRVANGLTARGVCAGDRVAVLVHNCPQFLEMLFGCAMLGAIFVPLNFRLVAGEIGRILALCTPKLLLAAHAFAEVVDELANSPGVPDHIVWTDDQLAQFDLPTEDDYERGLLSVNATEPSPLPSGDALAMLMFSSGTTGLPKGIAVSHAGIWASSTAKIIDFSLSAKDVTVVFGPLFHAGPLMDLALPLLLSGGMVVVGASRKFDPHLLLTTIAKHSGTVVPIYPTMLKRLIAEPIEPSLDISSLRLILTGGEAAPLPVIQGTQALFPWCEFINNYGSTEGGPVTCFLPSTEGVRKIGSVGRESFSVQIRIDDDQGQPLGSGAIGEIVVRSPFVCRGYWNKPTETAARIRDGWWRTGDLAWRDEEGFVWIAGRATDMVKTGAENVYPVEVEQVIATHPDVMEVAVIGVPDPQWGETVLACVVVAGGRTLIADQVVDFCRGRLAGYKKPRHVRFMAALPRGTTGKVDKRQLRRIWDELNSSET